MQKFLCIKAIFEILEIRNLLRDKHLVFLLRELFSANGTLATEIIANLSVFFLPFLVKRKIQLFDQLLKFRLRNLRS